MSPKTPGSEDKLALRLATLQPVSGVLYSTAQGSAYMNMEKMALEDVASIVMQGFRDMNRY